VVRPTGTTTTLNTYNAGRQTIAGARSVAYSYFDLPTTITDGVTRTYDYDASHQRARVRQGTTEDTIYVGNFFERRIRSGLPTENVLMVFGPNGRIAQLRQNDSSTVWNTDYTHSDHLGSATVTTNAAGDVTTRQWFGPFGVRLDNSGRDFARGSGIPANLRTGFTGHEQEDALGLVDMSGRFYDPYQRRFMTPDPLVADATSTQSWNAYSYVRNNPLNQVDPTGFEHEEAPSAPDDSDLDFGEPRVSTDGCGCGEHDRSDPWVAGDPGGDDFDGDIGYDPGDPGAQGNEHLLEQFEGRGGELGPDFGSGGNDGSAGVGKQDAGWQLPAGFEIDGPQSAFFTNLFQHAMELSPSFRSRVEAHGRTGNIVRIHAPGVPQRRSIAGAADVLAARNDPTPLGRVGEHTLDAFDFLTIPTATRGLVQTSQDQWLVHELTEAMEEFNLMNESMMLEDIEIGWNEAHAAAIGAENDFRGDIGAPGLLLFRGGDNHGMVEFYSDAPNVFYPAFQVLVGP
jgi:RHS repeat-associated protein